jgi:hypothetical protein
MLEQARVLAAKVNSVDDAWRSVLDRDPTTDERTTAEAFLETQSARLGSKPAAIAELVRGLLNTNEFLYVD